MAQAPWEMNWNAPQGSPAPQGGPVLGPPPKPEKPTEPKTTWRPMSAQEVQAEGLDPSGVYRISSQGQIEVVQKPDKSGPPKTETERKAAAAELTRTLRKIDGVAIDARDNGGWFETGFTGGLLRNVRGTASYDLGQDVQTIQSNTAFDRLQKMREDSPTGGALGNVTEKELDLLKSTVSSVDPDQSDSSFFKNLAETKLAYLERLRQIDPEAAAEFEKSAGIRFGPNGEPLLYVPIPGNEGGFEVYDINGNLQFIEEDVVGSANPKRTSAESAGSGAASFGDQLWEGIKAGTGDIVQAGGDVLGIVGNPLNATINAVTGSNLSTDLGRTAREATGLPQGNPTASMINRGAAGGLMFGGGAATLGARALPGVARNALLQVGASPVGDAIVGGAAAGSGEAVKAAGGGEAAQAGATLLGGLAGAGAVSRMGRQPRPMPPGGTPPTDPRSVIQAGQREGVKVMTSDVRPPTSAAGRTAQLVGENIPIAGTGDVLGGRATQQGQRVAATERFVAELGGNPASVDDVTRDFVATRSRQLNTLTNAKDSVIDAVKTPIAPIQLRGTLREIDSQIARLNRANPEAFAPVISKLQSFRSVLESGKSLREVEVNRRLLGDLFEDPGLAAIKGEGQKALNAIYGPLRADMGDAIEGALGKGARAKWQTANDKLSAMAGELGDSKFRAVLNKADSDPEEVARLLFSKKPGDVRRLYGNLSESGKNKARSAIIYKAAEAAMDGDTINPDRFKTALKAMDNATGIFFAPADKARIDGFVRLLQATSRAQLVGSSLNTGARNTGIVTNLGLAGVLGPQMAAISGSYGVLARIYESGPARDLILKLGKTKPGSPAEAAVGKRLSDYITRAGILQNPANDMGEAVNRSTTAAYAEDQEQK